MRNPTDRSALVARVAGAAATASGRRRAATGPGRAPRTWPAASIAASSSSLSVASSGARPADARGARSSRSPTTSYPPLRTAATSRAACPRAHGRCSSGSAVRAVPVGRMCRSRAYSTTQSYCRWLSRPPSSSLSRRTTSAPGAPSDSLARRGGVVSVAASYPTTCPTRSSRTVGRAPGGGTVTTWMRSAPAATDHTASTCARSCRSQKPRAGFRVISRGRAPRRRTPARSLCCRS